MPRPLPFCLTLLLFFMLSQTSTAHEFLLVPQQWDTYKSGQELPFSMASSHVFMKSEELESPESVAASYQGKALQLAPNKAYKTYDGTVKLGDAGAAILRGHRKGEVWAKTTKGTHKVEGEYPKKAVWMRKYEKFVKTLLPVDGKSEGFDTVVGDLLEIVPVDNPLAAGVGDVVRFKVLYDGKPISPELVKAVYDGFTDSANAFAYVTEPYGEGIADVKISSPGLWMVRVQHMVEVEGQPYTHHVMRACLLFPVSR